MINQIVLAGASEGLALGNMLFVLVAFLVLMLLIKHFAWGPVVKMMESRADKVSRDLDSAEEARKQAEADAAERSAQLQTARTDAKTAAGKQRDQIVALRLQQVSNVIKSLLTRMQLPKPQRIKLQLKSSKSVPRLWLA